MLILHDKIAELNVRNAVSDEAKKIAAENEELLAQMNKLIHQ